LNNEEIVVADTIKPGKGHRKLREADQRSVRITVERSTEEGVQTVGHINETTVLRESVEIAEHVQSGPDLAEHGEAAVLVVEIGGIVRQVEKPRGTGRVRVS